MGGAFFLFVFPKGSISTLMHHVLSLPGPGVGVALILGPVALVFILGLATCGIMAEGLVFLTTSQETRWRCLLTACCANVELLVFYWIIVFPRTKGWVSWDAVPLLLAIALAGGLVAGIVGWRISTRLPDPTSPGQRRCRDVWTR